MEQEKDIQKEIARYLQYNYSKKSTIQHLKNDGFSNDEINKHIVAFDKIDKIYESNLKYFLPSFLFLIVLMIYILSRFYNEEILSTRLFYLIITGFLAYTAYKITKNDSQFIAVTGVALLVTIACVLYDLFFPTTLSIGDKSTDSFIVIVLLLVLRGNYLLYKQTTSSN